MLYGKSTIISTNWCHFVTNPKFHNTAGPSWFYSSCVSHQCSQKEHVTMKDKHLLMGTICCRKLSCIGGAFYCCRAFCCYWNELKVVEKRNGDTKANKSINTWEVFIKRRMGSTKHRCRNIWGTGEVVGVISIMISSPVTKCKREGGFIFVIQLLKYRFN